jgi:integrase
MNAAVDSGFIVRSPATGVKLPAEATREMMFLTANQVAELADAAHPHYRCLIYSAAYTGLRWGELAGLKTERLNLMQRKLQVVEQLSELNGEVSWAPPKTAAGRRTIALPGFLVSMLEEQLAVPVVQETGLVFPSPTARPMRRNSFWARVWQPAIRATGLEGLRFHDLRHTCVALLISQGAHPKAVHEHMGHSSITVTYDRYGHLFPAIADQLAERLDAVYQEATTHTAARRADVRELART